MTEPQANPTADNQPKTVVWTTAVPLVARMILAVTIFLGIAFLINTCYTRSQELVKSLAGLLRPDTEADTVVLNTINEVTRQSKLVIEQVSVTSEVQRESPPQGSWLRVFGTTVSDVKAPAKVQFYLALQSFSAENIRVSDDRQRVIVTVPAPVLDTEIVDIDPARMEVKTSQGWLRWNRPDVQRDAIGLLRENALLAADTPAVRGDVEQAARDALLPLFKPLADALKPGVTLEIQFAVSPDSASVAR